ncbi:prenyltransferase/squalene oxidase repeat-containing protein [Pirellulaceae bacterium SH449]
MAFSWPIIVDVILWENSLAVVGVFGVRWWAVVLGVLFAVVALALLVASWTKWGQQKPLTKCVALAFLAHIWLLMYAYGTRVSTPGTGGGALGGPKTPSMHVSIQSAPFDPNLLETNSPYPEDNARDSDSDREALATNRVQPWEAPLPEQQDRQQEKMEVAALPETLMPAQERTVALKELAFVPQPSTFDDAALNDFLESLESETVAEASASSSAPVLPSESDLIAQRPIEESRFVPLSTPQSSTTAPPATSPYQNRFAINRMEIVRAGGGDENTEASVQLALEWLARAQSTDGGWYAAQHGGGNPIMINRIGPDGERRQNAGARANTAMTGLAILAFLGAGHHHYDGQYSANVAAGLRYLISQQKASGDLSGHDQNGREEVVRFARMYSHGMAALALAEAYAITKDPALAPVVFRAADYSVRAMNPQTGGWRYEFATNDPGDTSQFGWQAMFLLSAARGEAIVLDDSKRKLMHRFLDSVAVGSDRGLATYRPRLAYGQPDAPTATMTAEAMASRLLLGVPTTLAAQRESQRMMLSQLPGDREDNFYYWYYATLAMFQMRGADEGDLSWNKWNDAMKARLVSSQVTSGPDRGSWAPTCVWGPYGGRIYTTALGCLSLEVYYRFLPIYQTRQTAGWQPVNENYR